MKPRLTARREAEAPAGRESEQAGVEMGSAVHGLILYIAGLALAGASLSVHAEPARAAEAKRSAAAQMYVALHLQQYTGMCSESYAAAGSRGQPSVCQHEAAVEDVQPQESPALRASLSSKLSSKRVQ